MANVLDQSEIDALLAASQRARQSVSERASKLMQEHDIIQRNFKFELERETLQQKPRGRLRPKKTTRGGSGADQLVGEAPAKLPPLCCRGSCRKAHGLVAVIRFVIIPCI